MERELRPKNGQWMLKLPVDADWTPQDLDAEQAVRDRRVAVKKERDARMASAGWPRF